MTDRTIIADLGCKLVGKYQLRGRLGEGAMGIVYDGYDPDIDRPVAIKTVHRDLIKAAGGEAWLTRFSREARAAGRVLHANLVTIFDYLEHDGQPYLVMERIEAKTLADKLAVTPILDLGSIVALFVQILDGLAAIHAAGIVHRDLKPANVMLTDTGQVKLTDFGIARIANTDKTDAGMIGTPSYMAPEQFSPGPVDARADLYAAGVLLYEMLTGKKPYAGGGIEAVLRSAKGDFADPPSALASDLPQALDAVVMTAISAAPEDRFADAVTMREALCAAVGHAPPGTTQKPRSAPKNSGNMAMRLSAKTMQQLEERMMFQIGPMGRLLARRAAEASQTREDLLEKLLAELPDGPERVAGQRVFISLLSADRGAAVPSDAVVISTDERERIAHLLVPHLGPISTTLVRREADRFASLDHLIEALAETIPTPGDKAAFLASANRFFAKGRPDA